MTPAELLAPILANPDDDGPRLIFADWLEESGDGARAEFIRVQIELAKLPPQGCSRHDAFWHGCGGCQRTNALRRRERELFEANRKQWLRWLMADFPGVCEDSEFHRGFVETIQCGFADWLSHHAEILKATPLRLVRFSHRIALDVFEWRGVGRKHRECLIAGEWILDWDGTGTEDEWLLWLLSKRWPSVRFELPRAEAPIAAEYIQAGQVVYVDALGMARPVTPESQMRPTGIALANTNRGQQLSVAVQGAFTYRRRS